MSERISPQDEAAVRKFAEAGSSITYETAERAWAAMPKVLAELDVLRGEVERLKAENQELNDVIRWNA